MRDLKREQAIIVDHLAFSTPISAFRHLEHANQQDKKRWKKIPKQNWSKIKDINVRDELIKNWQADYKDCMYQRFVQFINEIFGMRVTPLSEKGFFGYTNSAKLLAKNAPIELGYIGFGGNNDTIYVQVSGEGCKHLFSKISPYVLHAWLSKVLYINKLNRIDLAYDDYDGNYSIQYAEKAYDDDAFKSPNGGRAPKCTTICERTSGKISGHTFSVGSRKSTVYWRIYDKALEQNAPEGTTWFRNEVELKQVNTDVLSNPAKSFAGINRFSQSINLEHGVRFDSIKKKSILDFNSKIIWAKRQCGRTISDILETLDGDINAVLGLLCDNRGGKFNLPDTYSNLLNHLQRA